MVEVRLVSALRERLAVPALRPHLADRAFLDPWDIDWIAALGELRPDPAPPDDGAGPRRPARRAATDPDPSQHRAAA